MNALSKIFVMLLFVAVASFVENLINLRREVRYKQARYCLVAALYGAMIIALTLIFNDQIQNRLINSKFFENGIIAVANAVIMIGFIIIKLLILKLSDRANDKPKKMGVMVERYYEYNELYSNWYLKKEWTNYRQLALGYEVCGIIGCGLVLGLIWGFGDQSRLWVYSFPCIAVLIINEYCNFLNGLTLEESGGSLRGDESFSVRVSQFFRVREILENIFPAQLLFSHTGCEFTSQQGADNLVDAMSKSDDRIDRIVAAHFELKEEGDQLDTDCVQATSELMHRKSVLFFNPFYRDVGDYIVLPVIDALLSNKKCLIVTSRTSTCNDVSKWMRETIKKYCKMDSLWKVGELCDIAPECNIGILSYGQLYNLKMLEVNRKFFSEVDFVLLIEPSLIINTSQLAISIISDEMGSNNSKPIYCICDRKVAGLVDTMSHLLRTEIVEVAATPIPKNIYAGMMWNASGDFMRQRLLGRQTKYLGNGTEIAAVAIKNQIPKVTWYSETKTPVKDLRWTAGQFYTTLCRYMNIPRQQKALGEKLNFVSNLWCTPAEKEQFIIVEDEFCNMFNTLDAYLSRSSSQIFVNVLAEDYLLRDYMRCNSTMFTTNPNTVPSLAPDYVKTERNVVMKLILTMAYRSMTEDEIRYEFGLIGLETEDVFATLTALVAKYTDRDDSVFTVKSIIKETDDGLHSENSYSISKSAFEMSFADTLKNARYIIEDEKGCTEYVDAKLFGHITQSMLPGQFITYDGKYYEVKLIHPAVGIVLHRASDLYDSRKYYRQIRKYTLNKTCENNVISTRKVMDVEISTVSYTINVKTTGYIVMRDNHDLKSAKVVDFSEDSSSELLTRQHNCKNVLRLYLPGTTKDIRFTICVLLSELFRSVFPSAWQYIAVTEKYRDDVEGVLNYLMYPLEGDLDEDDEYIYIIEDSAMDLGLLQAIERKLGFFFEIIAEYLDWHTEKMRESEHQDPVLYTVSLPKEEKKAVEREEKRKTAFNRFADRIMSIFRRRRKDEKAEQETEEAASGEEKSTEATEETSETADNDRGTFATGDETEEAEATEMPTESETSEDSRFTAEAEENEPEKYTVPIDDYNKTDEIPVDEKMADIVHVDNTDIFENDESASDSELFLDALFKNNNIWDVKKSRYQLECFLKFGFDEIDARIHIKETLAYLRARGLTDNSLTKARKRKEFSEAEKAEQGVEAVGCCDFCGAPLNGVSYERLNDGRTRCNDCSSSSIKTEEEFSRLFVKTVEMMEGTYHITFEIPINVHMTDANSIANATGNVFVPSSGFDPRVLGYAARSKTGHYSMVVENGSPRLACICTVVHEMTHIWQYKNWTPDKVAAMAVKYGPAAMDAIYEGMAMWASIQFMYCIGENNFAMNQEQNTLAREDIYGLGFKLFCNEYPLIKDGTLVRYSPFSKFPPLAISLNT